MKRGRAVPTIAMLALLKSSLGQALEYPVPTKPSAADASATLVVDFRGLVAFVPEGDKTNSYDPTKPMGAKGEVMAINAYLPRGDDSAWTASLKIPSRLEFGHGGASHPPHYAAIRIDDTYLGIKGAGNVVVPLASQPYGGGHATYVITFDAGLAAANVRYRQMDWVATVLEGDPRKPAPTLAAPKPADLTKPGPFVAILRLGEGQDLVASEDERLSDAKWQYAYRLCDVSSGEVKCPLERVEQTTYSHLASQAQASVSVKGPVVLKISKYEPDQAASVRTFSLQPDANKRIVVRLENGPANDLLENQGQSSRQEGYDHFKLTYLAALERLGLYSFPAKLADDVRGDPYCTPLAQFVQKRK